jgi:hypothetical protein
MWPNDLPIAAIVPVGPGTGQENRRVPWRPHTSPRSPTSPACGYGDKYQRSNPGYQVNQEPQGKQIPRRLCAATKRAEPARHHLGSRRPRSALKVIVSHFRRDSPLYDSRS